MEERMADAKKKTRTVAKPRNTAAKKAVVGNQVQTIGPSREQIAELARKYWAERGWQDGYAEQDWLRAEEELRGIAS
jgi:hypothetical protein